MSGGSFVIAPGHPCLDGHFPGRPVVPGVVLLDEVAAVLGVVPSGFASVRFSRPVLPGEVVQVTGEAGRFVGRVGDQVALQGLIEA